MRQEMETVGTYNTDVLSSTPCQAIRRCQQGEDIMWNIEYRQMRFNGIEAHMPGSCIKSGVSGRSTAWAGATR